MPDPLTEPVRKEKSQKAEVKPAEVSLGFNRSETGGKASSNDAGNKKGCTSPECLKSDTCRNCGRCTDRHCTCEI
jgi:hypothetical protein